MDDFEFMKVLGRGNFGKVMQGALCLSETELVVNVVLVSNNFCRSVSQCVGSSVTVVVNVQRIIGHQVVAQWYFWADRN